MTRFHASGFHFLISLFVGLLLLALCWFMWYPAPMLLAIGGHEIFLLIVIIDVVLGPLLTLVVFKTEKKSLKFDLVVIAFLQIGAMIYGMSTLLEARPAYVAALGDHFQVVQATEVTDANLAKAKVELPWWGPQWVGTKAPTERYDIDAVNDVASVGGGRGHFPQLHIPYMEMRTQILKKSYDISTVNKENPTKVKQIKSWLEEHNMDENKVKFQAIKIGTSIFGIVLDAKSAQVIGIMPFTLVIKIS